ncbi:hypothetical protein K431DRAFT_91849 [Polychaeton citri CBS 116435]|uniref:Uncharacterized protein n=1 Tax=Polychaeton citri CBS 116435 TaxID=1314669 RepID=A0A9P4UP63_9PEZI|nr:hypothetical protein K431DRAFT_91849 [Polychaeton citri CBS 116435]
MGLRSRLVQPKWQISSTQQQPGCRPCTDGRTRANYTNEMDHHHHHHHHHIISSRLRSLPHSSSSSSCFGSTMPLAEGKRWVLSVREEEKEEDGQLSLTVLPPFGFCATVFKRMDGTLRRRLVPVRQCIVVPCVL